MCKEMDLCKSAKKIVFFDIDDTLYNHKIGIPASTIDAIKKLRQKGNLAFICTGRSKAMIFPFIIDIGFDGIIAGAGTYVEYNGHVMERHDMDENAVSDAVRRLRQCGFMTVPEGHDYLYYEKEERWNDKYKAVYGVFRDYISDAMREIPEDEQGMCAAKISSVFTDESDYDKAVKLFSDEYAVINHGNLLMELIPKGFSKAEGIKRVINDLGIQLENTYAIGDSMNDYEMLTFVKHGIAMGNSDKKILEIADYITDNIENEGVRKALEHFELI